jgi:hypothetical protein
MACPHAQCETTVTGKTEVRPVQMSPFYFVTAMKTDTLTKPRAKRVGGNLVAWLLWYCDGRDQSNREIYWADLRAKCASDAKTLEHAAALLSHADSKITERVYRRKRNLLSRFVNVYVFIFLSVK